MDIFIRNVPNMRKILKKSTVAIAGCGGLGSNIAVSLTRAGVGKLIIADFDKVEPSNLNRQHYFLDDIGEYKVYALEKHLKNINKNIKIDIFNQKLELDSFNIFKNSDIIVEAFDSVESKMWLIENCLKNYPDKYLISASGISGVGDGDKIGVKNIGKLIVVGDQKSEVDMGLSSSKVGVAAYLQADQVISILMKEKMVK